MQSTNFIMQDIFGTALLDYQSGNYQEDIITYSSVAGRDVLPLPYLFRDYSEMPDLEKRAMALAAGTVLDIGCGAGSHSLHLQQLGLEVTGLDNSVGAIACCRLRGVKKTIYSTIYGLDGTKFDTLILLMNGIGLAETKANLNNFLSQLKTLLHPDGQILLDSSDIIYMYENKAVSQIREEHTREIMDYYGEDSFIMEYKGIKGDPFSWLYIDFDTLREISIRCGLHCELVMEGEHYDYLARLTIKK